MESFSPRDTIDVVLLCGPACGVDEHHRAFLDVGSIEGADEQLVVRTVDWVPALERHHVLEDFEGKGATQSERESTEELVVIERSSKPGAVDEAGPIAL